MDRETLAHALALTALVSLSMTAPLMVPAARAGGPFAPAAPARARLHAHSGAHIDSRLHSRTDAAARVEAEESTLSGRVLDAHGAAIRGARVRLSREDGSARETMSDETGAFTFAGLPSGAVVIEVTRAGFRTHVAVITIARGAGDPAGSAADGGGAGTSLDVRLDIGGLDDEVVVTASGQPQVTRETSKALTRIDAREIQARNAATLTEIVRFTPGVQVRDNGGPGQMSSMRIRGLRPDATAVLIDGMRFRDASTTQSDATSLLSTLHFVAADQVEVLRGSGSSLYGTNAVGGVVNIVTRAGGGEPRGEAQAEAGHLGVSRLRGSFGGGARDNRLSYSAGLLRMDVRDGLDGDDASRSTGGQGLVRYQIGSGTSVMGRLFGSDDRVALNVSPTASTIPAGNIPDRIVVPAIPVTPEQIARANAGSPFERGNATYIPGRNDPDSRRTSGFITSAVQLRQSTASGVSWQASYQRMHATRSFRNGPLGAGFQTPTETVSRYAGDIDTADVRGYVAPASWLSLSAGYELERESYFDRQDDNAPGAARLRTETRIAQQAHAAFGAAQVGLFDRRLQLSLSGRAQLFRLGRPELSAVGTRHAYDGVPLDAPPRALTGDISAAYLFAASGTKLRVHAGNAYRAPSLYERFGGGFAIDPVTAETVFTPYGDPRLRPDRYRSVDGGVDQYLWRDRLLASATVFYTNVLTLTAFDSSGRLRPETDPYGRATGYLNGSGGLARGVEAEVEARPNPSLRLSGSYTYTRSETREDITVPGFYLVPGVFAHTATLVATHQWRRVDATFDLFHGSRSYGSFFAAGRTRAFEFAGFTKAGIAAGYRVAGDGTRLVRGYVKVDNLFDVTYYQGGWRAPGRTALAGISVGF